MAKAGIVTAQGGVRSALDCGRNVFLLEAYDKLVEPGATGLDGKFADGINGGLLEAARTMKFDKTSGVWKV